MTNVVNNKTNDNGSTFEKLVSEDIMNDEGNTETVEEGVDSLVNEDMENFDKVMVQGSNPESNKHNSKILKTHSNHTDPARVKTTYADFFRKLFAKPTELDKNDSVMSDSDESGVTYTEVSSPFEGLSDIGSPRADDHEYLELPWMPEDPYVEAALQAPPSLDYVPGPKEPEQAPPSPDYVLGPEHADDEIVAKDQPYAEDASPTAQSPDYVPESDPEADLEEDDDEDPEEDPVDYSADGGDDGDDEDEPSEEDEDDDVDILRLMTRIRRSTHLLPTLQLLLYQLSIKPHLITIPAPVPTPVWSDTEVARLLAISTLPSSPLSPWSSPLPQIPSPPLPPILSPLPVSPPLPQISSPPLLVSSLVPVLSPSPPASPIHAPSSGTPPLHLLSTDRRADKPEVTLPPQKRLGIALGPRYVVGESSYAAAARMTRGLRMLVDMSRASTTDDTEMGRRMTEFTTRVSQDTYEIYTRLDDEQSERQLMAGRLNMMYRDRSAHARTARLMKAEAR
ncbi:hypothetical protein Tco_0164079, partial [Tanacetum coccineum]